MGSPMYVDYQITTAPACEPVALAQAKRHLRVDDDDTIAESLLRSYLRAARTWCEDYAGRAFVWQEITLKLSSFPALIQLPRPPLLSVTEISYIDTAGVTQVVDTSLYDVDTTTQPGKILLAYDASWPSDLRGHHHDITIEYHAGHAVRCTFDSATVLAPGHSWSVGDPVQLHTLDDDVPTPFDAETTYYVASVAAGGVLTLSATEDGDALELESTGEESEGLGTYYIDAVPESYRNAILLHVTRLWHNRGDEAEDLGPSKAERELLGMRRVWNV
jgi:uncharacterized phiE125 gp8 family phage protein